MADLTKSIEAVQKQSEWYGTRARSSQKVFVRLKALQLLMAAAIPVVAVAASGDGQRWTSAILGALIGIVEGILQLGQFQQNWLLYRATREALRSEERLYTGGAGPYAGLPQPDIAFIERCEAIMSGEHAKWLTAQQVPAKEKAATPAK
jgi:hypothetical protein